MTLKVRSWHFSIAWFRADVVWQFFFKSATFDSIKLPFDAEVGEKFLYVIYLIFPFANKDNLSYAYHNTYIHSSKIKISLNFYRVLLFMQKVAGGFVNNRKYHIPRGRRKLPKAGWASNNMGGIICPSDWYRVNWSAKTWMGNCPPSPPISNAPDT